MALRVGRRPGDRCDPRPAWLDTVEGEIETKGRNRRRVPIAGALRDYLDEQIMRLEWSEGLLFGASALSPFAPTSVTTRAMISWGWKRVRKPNSDQRIWVMTDEAVQPIGLHEAATRSRI
jgi:integrase